MKKQPQSFQLAHVSNITNMQVFSSTIDFKESSDVLIVSTFLAPSKEDSTIGIYDTEWKLYFKRTKDSPNATKLECYIAFDVVFGEIDFYNSPPNELEMEMIVAAQTVFHNIMKNYFKDVLNLHFKMEFLTGVQLMQIRTPRGLSN